MTELITVISDFEILLKNVFIKIKNCYIINAFLYICIHNARKLFSNELWNITFFFSSSDIINNTSRVQRDGIYGCCLVVLFREFIS